MAGVKDDNVHHIRTPGKNRRPQYTLLFELSFCLLVRTTTAARVVPQRPRPPGHLFNTLLAPMPRAVLARAQAAATASGPCGGEHLLIPREAAIFGPGTFHTRPGHVQDLPTHDLCVLGGSAADLLTWRRGGCGARSRDAPSPWAVSAVVWGFPYLEDRDKKSSISCHNRAPKQIRQGILVLSIFRK